MQWKNLKNNTTDFVVSARKKLNWKRHARMGPSIESNAGRITPQKRKGKEIMQSEGKRAKVGEREAMDTNGDLDFLAEVVKQHCQGL